jgi:hypothetical protein
MAKLEVVIGADSSEVIVQLSIKEKKIKDLARTKIDNIKN